MNKKQILFSALFLTFVCASAGAVPPEPSALSAFCPPSEGKAFHSEWISLGLKAADLKEKQASAGHITDVGEAQIQLHFPAGWSPQDKRTALCIFPGGGYAIQAIEKEGSRIAGWAAEHDMVGVVVKYRVSGTGNALGKFPGPLLDARQALRTVRKNASSLGIDPLPPVRIFPCLFIPSLPWRPILPTGERATKYWGPIHPLPWRRCVPQRDR